MFDVCVLEEQIETDQLNMDRRWMYGRRDTLEFYDGVNEFCRQASKHQHNTGGSAIYCPCVDCANVKKFSSITIIRDHVIRRGFRQQYHLWLWHGENVDVAKSGCGNLSNDQSLPLECNSPINAEDPRDDEHRDDGLCSQDGDGDDNDDVEVEENGADEYRNVMEDVEDIEKDRVEEMLGGVEDEIRSRPRVFESLRESAEKPLYPGCPNYTKLYVVAALFNVKMKGGWSDTSFTMLLEILHDMFPKGNELPKSTYYAKKVMCPLGLDYEKIDACPNDCVLYRNEHANLVACPQCDKSRFKLPDGVDSDQGAKGPSAKILWYLPIIPRFRRLFSLKTDAKNLRWHSDRRKGKEEDGMLRHPSDSPEWKTIDSNYSFFGREDRNLRLGLCTDGMNPFGTLSTQHSTWPVMLVIYNLPPWLCMKLKYIMLSLLISGPKQPGNDIDVYLAPLIDDLKRLWDEGVETNYMRTDGTDGTDGTDVETNYMRTDHQEGLTLEIYETG